MTRKELNAKEFWLTVADAAKLLNTTPRSVRRLIENERIETALSTSGRDRYLVRLDNFDNRTRSIRGSKRSA